MSLSCTKKSLLAMLDQLDQLDEIMQMAEDEDDDELRSLAASTRLLLRNKAILADPAPQTQESLRMLIKQGGHAIANYSLGLVREMQQALLLLETAVAKPNVVSDDLFSDALRACIDIAEVVAKRDLPPVVELMRVRNRLALVLQRCDEDDDDDEPVIPVPDTGADLAVHALQALLGRLDLVDPRDDGYIATLLNPELVACNALVALDAPAEHVRALERYLSALSERCLREPQRAKARAVRNLSASLTALGRL